MLIPTPISFGIDRITSSITSQMNPPKESFPRWLYHAKHNGRIFQTADEARWFWIKGWRGKPYPPPNERAYAKAKAWWEQWEWLFKAFAVILALIAGIIALIRALWAA